MSTFDMTDNVIFRRYHVGMLLSSDTAYTAQGCFMIKSM